MVFDRRHYKRLDSNINRCACQKQEDLPLAACASIGRFLPLLNTNPRDAKAMAPLEPMIGKYVWAEIRD
jgi:hypothetical protein